MPLNPLTGLREKIHNMPAIQLLALRSYRALFLSNIANDVGVNIRIMAQSWLILELGASQFWVGTAMGLRAIPALAIGLFAGVAIDRLGGRFVLIWERAVLLILAVLTAWVVVSGTVTLWQIVVLSIASSATVALGVPATQTLVWNYVPKDMLQAGTSINVLAGSLGRALGPLAAGLLIASFGIGSPFLALIGLYVLSLGFTFRLPREETRKESSSSAIRELIDGLNYMRKNSVILRLILIGYSIGFHATLVPIIPVYARDRFDVGGTGFGTMLAAWAIGGAITSVWIATKRDWKRKIPVVLIAAVMLSVSQVTFALSTYFPLTLFSLALFGAGIPVWGSAMTALVQTQLKDTMRGRVMSVYSLNFHSLAIGFFLGAWIGEYTGNAEMIIGSTVVFLLFHFGLSMSSKEIRSL